MSNKSDKSDKNKKEKSPFAGALADKLKDLDVDTSARSRQQQNQQDKQDKQQAEQASSPKSSKTIKSPKQAEPVEQALSDEELFQQAFQNVDREAIERAHRPPPPDQERAHPPGGNRVDQGVDQGTREDAEQAKPPDRQPADRQRTDRQPAGAEQPQKPLSERDLFEKAIEGLEAGDVYSGKFHGQGPELPPEPEEDESPESTSTTTAPDSQPLSEEQAREAVADRREKLQFERAIGPVDEKNERRRKYRRQSRPDPKEHVEQVTSFRSDSPDDMITPPLPKSGEGLNNVGSLTAAQKDMLSRYKKRSRRQEVPEINVRGDSVEDALRQIELFVHQQWKEKAHFVRIIHGRGLQSDGDPVLKPAVLRWLEGPGYRYIKGYVPEVNTARDYGSVVAELEQKD